MVKAPTVDAVETIRETVKDEGDGAGVDVPVTYWKFWMTAADDHRPDEYFMVTQEDERGHLWTSFFAYQDEAREALAQEKEQYGELSFPWTIFARAAQRILAGATRASLPEGALLRHGPGLVGYRAGCGQEYLFTDDTLRGLLA